MRMLVELWNNRIAGPLAAGAARGFKVTTSGYYVGLAILLVLMVLASVQAYKMWEEIHDVEEPDSPAELLEAFEEAHALGELDDEEFASTTPAWGAVVRERETARSDGRRPGIIGGTLRAP